MLRAFLFHIPFLSHAGLRPSFQSVGSSLVVLKVNWSLPSLEGVFSTFTSPRSIFCPHSLLVLMVGIPLLFPGSGTAYPAPTKPATARRRGLFSTPFSWPRPLSPRFDRNSPSVCRRFLEAPASRLDSFRIARVPYWVKL